MTSANFARLDLAALKYRALSSRCCKRAELLLSVRGRTHKKILQIIGGRMCLPIHAPADKREAATAVVL
jgi:hypothetical protein